MRRAGAVPWREDEAALLGALGSAARLLVAVDFDGTLAPLVPAPEDARSLPGALEALAQLDAAAGVTAAIVTGRRLDELRALEPATSRFLRLGGHGAELAEPEGAPRPAPGVDHAAVASALCALAPTLHATLHETGVARLEDKGYGFAIHTRGMSPSSAAALRSRIEAQVAAWRRRGARLALLEGHDVVELRQEGVDKGRALALLVERCRPDAVLCVGDDATDEDAFAMLKARPGAVSVRVAAEAAPPRTEASHWVHGPGEVLGLLERLARARLRRD